MDEGLLQLDFEEELTALLDDLAALGFEEGVASKGGKNRAQAFQFVVLSAGPLDLTPALELWQ